VGKRPKHQKFQLPQKAPVVAREPEPHKLPRAAVSIDSHHHLRPSWRVSGMELADPYGWRSVTRETLLYIREKLAHFESMTWSEILVNGKKRNHSIKVSEITSEARRRLEAKALALDEVVSLRLSGAERVFGYLDNGVLVLLWWDPDHEVCPSLKK
jgi:hypothetical protein